jgi:hypothetical protein
VSYGAYIVAPTLVFGTMVLLRRRRVVAVA